MQKLKWTVLGVLCIILSSSSVAGAEDLNVLLMGSTFRIAGPARGEGKISVGTVFFVGRPLNFIAGLVSQHAAIDGQRLQLAAVVPAQFIGEAIDSLPEPQ